MKKIISIMLALLILLSVFVSCTDGGKTTEAPSSMAPTESSVPASSEPVSTPASAEGSETASPTQNSHTHEYAEAVTKEATCTEKGVKTFTCVCGDSYTEDLPKVDHSVENGACVGCGAKTTELLEGKTAIFFGDSIVIATGEAAHPTWGYAGRIARDYGLRNYKNAGVNGASISNCRGDNTVIDQIKDNRSPKYQIVVLEGGTNDAWDSAPVGKMSDIAPEDVTADTFKETFNTFCGGLEYTIYQAKKRQPSATLLYVITPQMNLNAGKLTDMREYVDATLAICEKWGVPCLNFYDMGEEYYGNNKSSYFTSYVPDGVHPNSECYEIIAPYVADAMAEALLNK